MIQYIPVHCDFSQQMNQFFEDDFPYDPVNDPQLSGEVCFECIEDLTFS